MPERLLGQTLGSRYRLTRLIGAGAYAWVYEALDTELEIPVAVKVLRPEHTGNDVTETRFRREATTAARLRHPHIISIRDVGRTDGATWVVMDLVPGSLARRLQVLPALPESEVVRIGLDVAAALTAAHAAGVVHRDIKPDNILLGAGGEAIVCDFGLARALAAGADLSATNQVVGTPHYFSPEQARGEPLDGRSDLYALGVTLFRAATGRLPFEGDDWYAVARQHIESPPPDPRAFVSSLTPAFAALLLRLLAKAPEARVSSAVELAQALAALPTAPSTAYRSGDAAITAIHPALAAPSRRPRRVLLGTLAVAVLAAVVWVARGTPDPATIWARVSAPPSVSDTAVPRADSLPRPVDSVTTAAGAGPDSTRPAVTPRRPAAAPRTGTLTVEATAGSEVRVNGRRAPSLPWRIDDAPAGRYTIEGRLVDGAGITDCPFAARSDVVSLRLGEHLIHTLALARCTRLVVNVTPADARLTLTDTSGTTVSRSSDSPFLLRAGPWTIRATAPRCAPFEGVDTLRAGDDTIKIAMLCR